MHSHCTLNCTLIYYYTKVSAPKCSLTLRSYPFLSCTHLHSKEILLKCTHIALIYKNLLMTSQNCTLICTQFPKSSLRHSYFNVLLNHLQKCTHIALKCEKNDTLICTQIPNILYCTHIFWRSNIGNCRETLWSNLITGRIIHQGKKAAKDVLQRFVCLMLSTFPFCTTAENVFFLESHSKGCFPPFFPSLSAIRRIVSFLLERRTEKSFSLMCHYHKINLIKGNYSG